MIEQPSRLPGTGALALRLLLLLLAAASMLTWLAMNQLRDTAQSEAEARAQLVADALAARVARAVALGIPLARLEGVEDLFAQRMGSRPDVAALALEDGKGQVLWTRARDEAAATLGGLRAMASVDVSGQTVASVLLVWRESGTADLLLRWALPLAALVAAVAALAAEALRRAWAGGAAAREALVQVAARSVAGGDFGLRLAPLPRRDFDARLPWLAGELRYANEQYLRVRRLVGSLRKTEPEAARRAALDDALSLAAGQDTFGAHVPALALQAPGLALARQRWRGVAAATLAWLAATLVVLAVPEVAAAWPRAALPASLLLCTPLAFALGRLGGRGAYLPGFAIGYLAIGPGLALPLLLRADSPIYQALGAVGGALLAWSAVSSAVVALVVLWPRHRLAGSSAPQGKEPHAA